MHETGKQRSLNKLGLLSHHTLSVSLISTVYLKSRCVAGCFHSVFSARLCFADVTGMNWNWAPDWVQTPAGAPGSALVSKHDSSVSMRLLWVWKPRVPFISPMCCHRHHLCVWAMGFLKEGCSVSLCPHHPGPDEPMDLLNGFDRADRGQRHNLRWCRGWLRPPWDILERRGGHWGHMWTPLMGTVCELQRHRGGLWMDLWAVGAPVRTYANHGDTEGDVWATGTLRGCDWTTRTWRTCAVGTLIEHVWPMGTLQGRVWPMMILRGDNEGTHVSPGTLRGRDWGDACDLWGHYGGVYEQWNGDNGGTSVSHSDRKVDAVAR